MLDQPNAYCPGCGQPQPSSGPGGCAGCGTRFSEPRIHTVSEMLSLPRRPCQGCYRSMPDFATICERCGVVQDPARSAPLPLPKLYQDNLDHRSFEDNVLYVVLGAGTPEPDAAAVIGRLAEGRLQIHDVADAEHRRGHRPVWEKQLFAELPERPQRSWESTVAGVRPRRGERVHLWLEQTGLPADMGLDPDALSETDRSMIRDSAWSIGLHCETRGAPPWNTLMMMRLVGQILPGVPQLVVEAATGRILPEVWREAAEVRPPAVRECYSILTVIRDGVAWVRTRGLPRWGCFELEVLDCAADRVGEAGHLIHAVAAALIGMDELPPPWRPLYFKNGAAFAWVPLEHIADRVPAGVPGTLPAERKQLKHATVVLVSPYFGPETFRRITAQPEPPTRKPAPPAAPSPASSRPAAAPPLPAANNPRALVALISFVLPGAAQIWLGQRAKGSAMLAVGLLTCGGLGLLSLLSAIDAYRLAGRLADGEQPGEWDWL